MTRWRFFITSAAVLVAASALNLMEGPFTEVTVLISVGVTALLVAEFVQMRRGRW